MNVDEQIAQVRQDLVDVQQQATSGDLDVETAQRLAATYEDELSRLETLETEDSAVRRRSPGRVVVGALILVASFVAITWAASGSLIDREADAFDAPQAQTDLDAISNDEMVAVIEANPDIAEINRMRLALAERYFEVGDYSNALPWLQTVLDNTPSAFEESEALGRIGWMIFESNDAETAERFLDLSLTANPSNLESTYFRGLLYAGTGRPELALADLRIVAGTEDIPDDVRTTVEDLIALIEEES